MRDLKSSNPGFLFRDYDILVVIISITYIVGLFELFPCIKCTACS